MSITNSFQTGQGYVRTTYSKKLLIILLVIFTVLLCVAGSVTLPIGKVPITPSTFILVLIGVILGPIWGLIPVAAYFLLGAAGVPVFSGGVGNVSILFGPTGGYIFGWLFLVLLTGLFVKRFHNPFLQFAGVLLGELAFYITGVIWYMAVSKALLIIAILFGVLSFTVSNLLQGIAGFLIGFILNKILSNNQAQKG